MRRLSLFVGLALLLVLALAGAAGAQGISGTASITGGTLDMSATDAPAFSATLDGTDKTASDDINIDVNDARGTGAGWHLDITSTTFDDASGHTLSTDATSITQVTAACDAGTCTDPDNIANDGIYPLLVPAGATAPGAVEFYEAAADTGMGDFTITPSFQLSIPANTYAGTYTSTVTLTISETP